MDSGATPKLLWVVGWESPDPTADGRASCGMDTEGWGSIKIMFSFVFYEMRAVNKTLEKSGKVGFAGFFGFLRVFTKV